jgi:hypothetical protein
MLQQAFVDGAEFSDGRRFNPPLMDRVHLSKSDQGPQGACTLRSLSDRLSPRSSAVQHQPQVAPLLRDRRRLIPRRGLTCLSLAFSRSRTECLQDAPPALPAPPEDLGEDREAKVLGLPLRSGPGVVSLDVV